MFSEFWLAAVGRNFEPCGPAESESARLIGFVHASVWPALPPLSVKVTETLPPFLAVEYLDRQPEFKERSGQ